MNTKKEIRYFSIFEHEKEQDYLRRMHRSGWRFVSVSGFCVYRFEQCAPEDVIYQLDYNQDGLAHKQEYVQMFRDCGWEYLQDYVGYSYFRKPASQTDGSEEIFCDQSSRVQMLERVFKGRILPLAVLFLCVLLPQFVVNLLRHRLVVSIALGVVLVLYLAIFLASAWKYYKSKH